MFPYGKLDIWLSRNPHASSDSGQPCDIVSFRLCLSSNAPAPPGVLAKLEVAKLVPGWGCQTGRVALGALEGQGAIPPLLVASPPVCPIRETQECPHRCGVIPQLAPSPGGNSLGKGMKDSAIMWQRRRVAWWEVSPRVTVPRVLFHSHSHLE